LELDIVAVELNRVEFEGIQEAFFLENTSERLGLKEEGSVSSKNKVQEVRRNFQRYLMNHLLLPLRPPQLPHSPSSV